MRRIALVLLLACGTRGHHVYRLPSACQDADDAAEAEACGAWLLDEMMTAQLGVYEDRALERYVRQVGERVAAESGRDDIDWTFRILDDPGVQAWAAPGGFVYVTRGLLAFLDSEAELAAVLGHEIAHVAAGHTEELMHRLPEPSMRDLDLATLFQLHRDDEAQADQVGVRLAAAAGYDPSALQRALAALHQPGLMEDAPSWSDRHPPLAARLSLAARAAGSDPHGRHGRRRYLEAVAGLVVGEDPRRGVVADGRFVHSAAGLSFAMPEGWKHPEDWEPGRLHTQWFRAWSEDESMGLLFLPLTHARGSVIEAAIEAEMGRAPTRERTIAGYRAVEGVLPVDDGKELHFSDGVADVRMLVIHARDGYRYGLMVAANRMEDGGHGDAEALYRSIAESFRRERRAPTRARRIRPRQVDAAMSVGDLMADGCGRGEEATLVALLNELDLEGTVPSERTIKCLAP